MGHHSTSDDSTAYRGREEIESWTRQNNPINRFKKYLIRKDWWSEGEDDSFRDQIRKVILAEFGAAEQRKKPPIEEMFNDVYNEMPWNLMEQREELRQILKELPEKYPSSQHLESPSLIK